MTFSINNSAAHVSTNDFFIVSELFHSLHKRAEFASCCVFFPDQNECRFSVLVLEVNRIGS